MLKYSAGKKAGKYRDNKKKNFASARKRKTAMLNKLDNYQRADQDREEGATRLNMDHRNQSTEAQKTLFQNKIVLEQIAIKKEFILKKYRGLNGPAQIKEKSQITPKNNQDDSYNFNLPQLDPEFKERYLKGLASVPNEHDLSKLIELWGCQIRIEQIQQEILSNDSDSDIKENIDQFDAPLNCKKGLQMGHGQEGVQGSEKVENTIQHKNYRFVQKDDILFQGLQSKKDTDPSQQIQEEKPSLFKRPRNEKQDDIPGQPIKGTEALAMILTGESKRRKNKLIRRNQIFLNEIQDKLKVKIIDQVHQEQILAAIPTYKPMILINTEEPHPSKGKHLFEKFRKVVNSMLLGKRLTGEMYFRLEKKLENILAGSDKLSFSEKIKQAIPIDHWIWYPYELTHFILFMYSFTQRVFIIGFPKLAINTNIVIAYELLVISDIFINFFRTPYKSRFRQLPLKTVAVMYLKFQIYFDILSIVPWAYIDEFLHIMILLRVRHLLRAMEYVTQFMGILLVKVKKVSSSIGSVYFYQKLTYILVTMIITFQVLTFIVIYQFGLREQYFDRNLTDYNQALQIYNTILYIIIVTVTTVGYGDLTPTSPETMITTILMQIIGIIFFGYIMTKVRGAIEGNYGYVHYLQEQRDDLDAWSISREREFRAPAGDLMIHVKEAMIFSWNWKNEEVLSNQYFTQLDHQTKFDIGEGQIEYLKKKYKSFFHYIPNDLVHDMLSYIEARSYKKGEILIGQQKISQGIFLIVDGECHFRHHEYRQAHFMKYTKGGYFGDRFLIEEVEQNQLHAGTDMKVLFIPREIIIEMVQKSPEVGSQLRGACIHKLVFLQIQHINYTKSIENILMIYRNIKLTHPYRQHKRNIDELFQHHYVIEFIQQDHEVQKYMEGSKSHTNSQNVLKENIKKIVLDRFGGSLAANNKFFTGIQEYAGNFSIDDISLLGGQNSNLNNNQGLSPHEQMQKQAIQQRGPFQSQQNQNILGDQQSYFNQVLVQKQFLNQNSIQVQTPSNQQNQYSSQSPVTTKPRHQGKVQFLFEGADQLFSNELIENIIVVPDVMKKIKEPEPEIFDLKRQSAEKEEQQKIIDQQLDEIYEEKSVDSQQEGEIKIIPLIPQPYNLERQQEKETQGQLDARRALIQKYKDQQQQEEGVDNKNLQYRLGSQQSSYSQLGGMLSPKQLEIDSRKSSVFNFDGFEDKNQNSTQQQSFQPLNMQNQSQINKKKKKFQDYANIYQEDMGTIGNQDNQMGLALNQNALNSNASNSDQQLRGSNLNVPQNNVLYQNVNERPEETNGPLMTLDNHYNQPINRGYGGYAINHSQNNNLNLITQVDPSYQPEQLNEQKLVETLKNKPNSPNKNKKSGYLNPLIHHFSVAQKHSSGLKQLNEEQLLAKQQKILQRQKSKLKAINALKGSKKNKKMKDLSARVAKQAKQAKNINPSSQDSQSPFPSPQKNSSNQKSTQQYNHSNSESLSNQSSSQQHQQQMQQSDSGDDMEAKQKIMTQFSEKLNDYLRKKELNLVDRIGDNLPEDEDQSDNKYLELKYLEQTNAEDQSFEHFDPNESIDSILYPIEICRPAGVSYETSHYTLEMEEQPFIEDAGFDMGGEELQNLVNYLEGRLEVIHLKSELMKDTLVVQLEDLQNIVCSLTCKINQKIFDEEAEQEQDQDSIEHQQIREELEVFFSEKKINSPKNNLSKNKKPVLQLPQPQILLASRNRLTNSPQVTKNDGDNIEPSEPQEQVTIKKETSNPNKDNIKKKKEKLSILNIK